MERTFWVASDPGSSQSKASVGRLNKPPGVSDHEVQQMIFENGRRVTSSTIVLTEEQTLLTGDAAKHAAYNSGNFVTHLIESIKVVMLNPDYATRAVQSTAEEDIAEMSLDTQYLLENTCLWGEPLSLVIILTWWLRDFLVQATSHISHQEQIPKNLIKIPKVTVCVPQTEESFDSKAWFQAAKEVGIEDFDVALEIDADAACLYLEYDDSLNILTKDEDVIIMDGGGGTFDWGHFASGGPPNVGERPLLYRGASGCVWCGGLAIERRIKNLLYGPQGENHKEVIEDTGISPGKYNEVVDRWVADTMASFNGGEQSLVCLFKGKKNRIISVRSEDMDAIFEDCAKAAVTSIKRAIDDGRIDDLTRIKMVLLVGGLCRAPRVRHHLSVHLEKVGIDARMKVIDDQGPDADIFCASRGAPLRHKINFKPMSERKSSIDLDDVREQLPQLEADGASASMQRRVKWTLPVGRSRKRPLQDDIDDATSQQEAQEVEWSQPVGRSRKRSLQENIDDDVNDQGDQEAPTPTPPRPQMRASSRLKAKAQQSVIDGSTQQQSSVQPPVELKNLSVRPKPKRIKSN